jgi:hypothetical protein
MKSSISRPVKERKERPNALTTPKEDSPLFGLDLFITDQRDLISSAHSFTSCSGIPNTPKRSRHPRPAPTVCYLQLNWICNRIGYKNQQKIFDQLGLCFAIPFLSLTL